jgi:peptide-methionine (S)-S-oxide reductase
MSIHYLFFCLLCNLSLFSQNMPSVSHTAHNKTEILVLGGGCFWCIEAVFQDVEGVLSVSSGYSGGTLKNPSYEAVCGGNTGHAEVCKIEYDASIVTCETLLELFFSAHDPTTLNRQGNDIGTQYRSVIFYTTDLQAQASKAFILNLSASGLYSKPICTQVLPLMTFYKAEPYHQNYFNNHPTQGYCQFVIAPKVKAVQLKHPKRFKH